MFKKLALLAEELKSPLVDIELEARMKIHQPLNIEFDNETTINYYRSTMYPTLIFRRINNSNLNSKELVEKIKKKDIVVALSVEQSYTKSEIKFSLIPSNTRKIFRKRINENPIVEITKCENEYNIEIEFNINNYNLVSKILKDWRSPYWPAVKPIEISCTNLARKLTHSNEWVISPKADGEHVIEYVNDQKRVILHDNGYVSNLDGSIADIINPKYVYEGELMENKKILYFDCLMHNYKNITKHNYLERVKYLKNRKEFNIFNDIYSLKSYLYKPHEFKTDGYIITNFKNRNIVYKSKFINTIDLRYVNGYLLLENEIVSERIPNDTSFPFEEDKIYEFDMQMNLIKPRLDKSYANFRFPYDDNPIYKIVNGIGIPTLRNHHNKIKMCLLELLPKSTLLDIGSAKGGDIHKWYHLNFKKIYAVDPYLDLRQHSKNVVEIKEPVEDVYNLIDYECVSILFVPWNNNFLKPIKKAKHIIIAWMSKPFNHVSEPFTCNVNQNVTLKIPHTETSLSVTENINDYNSIIQSLVNDGWIHEQLETKMHTGTDDEKKLSSMYTYHYLKRKN